MGVVDHDLARSSAGGHLIEVEGPPSSLASDLTSHFLLGDEDSAHTDAAEQATPVPRACPSLEATISSLRQLRMREQQFRTTFDYLHQGEPQPGSEQGVTPHMRMIVVSWLTEVTDEFHASNETLHLSVHLLDRFLSQTQDVPGCVLQLVAVACFLVACKQLEVRQPTVEQLTAVAASCFSGADLVRMTRLLLDALDWRVTCPTPALAAGLALQQLGGRLGPATPALAQYLLELCLLDYGLVGVPPSQLATAALLLAGLTTGEAPALAPALAALGLTLDTTTGPALLAWLHTLHRAAQPPEATAAAQAAQAAAAGGDACAPAAAAAAAAAGSFWELLAPVVARHVGSGGALVAPLEALPPPEHLVGLWAV